MKSKELENPATNTENEQLPVSIQENAEPVTISETVVVIEEIPEELPVVQEAKIVPVEIEIPVETVVVIEDIPDELLVVQEVAIVPAKIETTEEAIEVEALH